MPAAVALVLNAALQIATDMWIVFLPMPVLVRLKLPRRHKVAVVLVFGLGILYVTLVSILPLKSHVLINVASA